MPDLATARAVLAWAAAGRHRVVLYGLDARAMGVGFWRAVADILDRPLIVDCDDHVGTALAALRVGLGRLFVGDAGTAAPALAGLAAAHGAALVRTPPALRLSDRARATAELAAMRFEEVTRPPAPDKDRGETSDIRATRDRLGCV